VPAVIETLWDVNHDYSSQIMLFFYDLLSKGYTKDEALREAKLAFLSEEDGFVLHPFFWANYISIGDEVAIGLSKRSFIELYWFYGMLIVFSILGIAVFVWRINSLYLGRHNLKTPQS